MSKIKSIGIKKCQFCNWKPSKDSSPKFGMVKGAVYVFCPKCGYELVNAQFLIGEHVEEE